MSVCPQLQGRGYFHPADGGYPQLADGDTSIWPISGGSSHILPKGVIPSSLMGGAPILPSWSPSRWGYIILPNGGTRCGYWMGVLPLSGLDGDTPVRTGWEYPPAPEIETRWGPIPSGLDWGTPLGPDGLPPSPIRTGWGTQPPNPCRETEQQSEHLLRGSRYEEDFLSLIYRCSLQVTPVSHRT